MSIARRSSDEPIALSDSLSAVARRVTKRDLVGVGAIQEVWGDVVGDLLATGSTPEKLEAGRLTVTVESSVWAGQIRLLAAEILNRLAERATPAVTSLDVVVRRSDR